MRKLIAGRAGWLIGLVLVLAVAAFALRRPEPPTVDVVAVEAKPAERRLALTGRVEAIVRSQVTSPLSPTRILRVLVEEGDRVQEGQVLAILDDIDLRAEEQAAVASVVSAEASLKQAQTDVRSADRATAIAAERTTLALDLKRARDAAQAAVRVAEKRRDQAVEATRRVRAGGRAEEVADARARLDSAKSNLRLAELESGRRERLVREGAIAQSEVDRAQATLDAARSQVSQAQAQLEIAQRPRDEDLRQAEAAELEAVRALEGARSELRNAEAALAAKLSERTGLVEALNREASSESAIAVAQARLKVARAQLGQVQARLKQMEVRAPFDGVVVQRFAQPGEAAGSARNLFTLDALNAYRLIADVEERFVGLLSVGQQAEFVLDRNPNAVLRAEITEIGRAADATRGTVPVRLRILNAPADLKGDLTADINVRLESVASALLIPDSAVLRQGGKTFAVRIQNGMAERIPIRVDFRASSGNVVGEGLSSGDRVALAPRTAPIGQPIRPREVSP